MISKVADMGAEPVRRTAPANDYFQDLSDDGVGSMAVIRQGCRYKNSNL